ncbi:Hypothetical protein A7982_10002 [Minicystis rosea]|nr:Hypothetical protein A7982_10002 [Minicystis rosea]
MTDGSRRGGPAKDGSRLTDVFLVPAVAFTVSVTAWISIADARGGGLLASYFEEYAGGGSCKWRGPEGQAFQLLLMVGLLAWPAGLGAVGVALVEAITSRNEGARHRRALVVFAVVSIVVAAALLRLVNLRAVAGARGAC